MADAAKQSLLDEEEGGGRVGAASSSSSTTLSTSPFSTTQCLAALAATLLLYLYASSGAGGKAATPPVKTGPQFGLSMDAPRATSRTHRDARGSPHSVAFRRARDELKTKHIREAQSDPNSMFDMSTP